MKYKLLFSFILINIIFGFAQHYEINPNLLVEYDFNFQTDSTNTDKKFNEKMNLYIDNDLSYFISENFIKYDSVLKSDKRIKRINFDEIPKPQLWIGVIKDFKNADIYFSDKIFSYKLFYKDSLEKIDWKLTKKEKDILGYKCKEATANYRGREWIAYYTDEIPITDGPYKFNGLPGLILQIYDSNNYFNFKVINIKKVKDINLNISFMNNINTNTVKEYYFNKIKIFENIRRQNEVYEPVVYNPIELE